MDLRSSKPICWEITGCGCQDECRVLSLAKSSGKSCWEVVETFEDYRSALNVCGDCIVSVLSNCKRAPSQEEIDNLERIKAKGCTHQGCPGLASSS